MNKREQQPDFLPEIRVGKIGELKVHQISDEELTRLTEGSGKSLFLNLGIGVLSVAASFLISLLTTTISSIRVFNVFVIVTIIGFLAGLVFMILWWHTRQPISRLTEEIRDRMPPQGEVQQFSPDYGRSSGEPTEHEPKR